MGFRSRVTGGEEMDGAHGIGTGLMPYSGGNRPAEGPTMNISSDMLTRPARGRHLSAASKLAHCRVSSKSCVVHRDMDTLD